MNKRIAIKVFRRWYMDRKGRQRSMNAPKLRADKARLQRAIMRLKKLARLQGAKAR